MNRLRQFLCWHEYEEIARYWLRRNVDNAIVGTRFVSRCAKCGHINIDDAKG